MPDLESEFVHMARLAVYGKTDDVAALFRKAVPSLIQRRPDLADGIATVLGMLDRTSLSRSVSAPLPVDSDSKLGAVALG